MELKSIKNLLYHLFKIELVKICKKLPRPLEETANHLKETVPEILCVLINEILTDDEHII